MAVRGEERVMTLSVRRDMEGWGMDRESIDSGVRLRDKGENSGVVCYVHYLQPKTHSTCEKSLGQEARC